jgi:hypothetical protein
MTTAVEGPIEVVDDAGGELRVRFPVVVIEGTDTSDGRFLTPGSLSPRALPLSVLAQPASPHGGDEPGAAVVIGRIDTLTRTPGPEMTSRRTGQPFPEGTFIWSGEGSIDGAHPVADLVRRRYLRGVSVDLCGMDFEVVGEEGFAPDPANPRRQVITHAAEIAAVTLVPIPAFGDAYVELADEDTVPEPITAGELPEGLMASAVPAWRSAELGDAVVAAVPAAKRDKAEEEGDTYPGTDRYPISTREMARNAIRLHGNSDIPAEKVKAWLIRRLKAKGWGDLLPDDWQSGSHGITREEALTATGVSRRPPLSWFTDPGLDCETPITIEDDGHVYGHIAVWSRAHIGYGGQPIYAQPSRCDYAFFNTGAVRCVDNDGNTRIAAVGHLTIGDDHADTMWSLSRTKRHYADATCAWADVAAGDDKWGIWVNGITKPGISEETITFALAHPPSIDERPIDGHLELVAAHCVNTPGIPVPRARVASGEVMALVAAGALPPRVPESGPALDYEAMADAFLARLDQREEQRRQADEMSAAHAALVTELDDTPALVAALLADVDGTSEQVAELLDELDDSWYAEAVGILD